jgi:hypothetical protein
MKRNTVIAMGIASIGFDQDNNRFRLAKRRPAAS